MPDDKPLLDPGRAIQLIHQQIEKKIEHLPFDDPQAYRWWNTTRIILQDAFGATHSNVFEFSSTSPSQFPDQRQDEHAANIRQRKALLEGFIEQLELLPPTVPKVAIHAKPVLKRDKQRAINERAARRQSVVLPILDRKNWTQGRLATEAGVSKNSAYRYLDGTRSRISADNRKAIADSLGIEVHKLPE